MLSDCVQRHRCHFHINSAPWSQTQTQRFSLGSVRASFFCPPPISTCWHGPQCGSKVRGAAPALHRPPLPSDSHAKREWRWVPLECWGFIKPLKPAFCQLSGGGGGGGRQKKKKKQKETRNGKRRRPGSLVPPPPDGSVSFPNRWNGIPLTVCFCFGWELLEEDFPGPPPQASAGRPWKGLFFLLGEWDENKGRETTSTRAISQSYKCGH